MQDRTKLLVLTLTSITGFSAASMAFMRDNEEPIDKEKENEILLLSELASPILIQLYQTYLSTLSEEEREEAINLYIERSALYKEQFGEPE